MPQRQLFVGTFDFDASVVMNSNYRYLEHRLIFFV